MSSLGAIYKGYMDSAFESALNGKKIDVVKPGDTVVVKLRNIDGASERISSFQGVCIERRSSGITSCCVLRKISGNIGVEKIIYFCSPLVISVEVIRRGAVRRANISYLRNLSGKKARIKEARFDKSKK